MKTSKKILILFSFLFTFFLFDMSAVEKEDPIIIMHDELTKEDPIIIMHSDLSKEDPIIIMH